MVLADDPVLNELVSTGLKEGHLPIGGQRPGHRSGRGLAIAKDIRGLDEYLHIYGPLLAKQAEQSLHPLHVPGRDPLPVLDLLREPFDAQTRVIAAARKTLHRQKALLLVGEMGTGKTLMAIAELRDVQITLQSYRAVNGISFGNLEALAGFSRSLRLRIDRAAPYPLTSMFCGLGVRP